MNIIVEVLAIALNAKDRFRSRNVVEIVVSTLDLLPYEVVLRLRKKHVKTALGQDQKRS